MMDLFDITPLFSGSSGNCTLIQYRNTNILIDSGVSARRIENALRMKGISGSDISAVFVTHEHIDHICGLPILAKKYSLEVHMTEDSYEALSPDYPVITHPVIFSVDLECFTARSFPLSHDTACCVGYVFESETDRIGIMTDTGYVTDEAAYSLKGCRAVVIESNHDVDMVKNGPYPYPLKRRILSDTGHLSNEDCAKFCSFLAKNGTRIFILAHLSGTNNSPDTAYKCIKDEFDKNGISADVEIAKRDITCWI